MPLETPPQLALQQNQPPLWDRISRMWGLDYEAPIGVRENIKEIFSFTDSARTGVSRIMSLSNTES